MTYRQLLPLLATLLAGCYDFDKAAVECHASGRCDGTAPELQSSSPAPLATNVPPILSFTLVFSEPMDTAATSAALDRDVQLANPIWEEDDTRVTFTPLSQLSLSTSYVLSVTGRDKAGNPLQDAQIAFTTHGPPDITPPTITSFLPGNGATNVAATQKLTFIFSEAMDPSSLEVTIEPPYDLGAPTWTQGNTRVDFLGPPAPLAKGQTYTVSVVAKDKAQNLLVNQVEYSFTTEPPPDTVAPTMVSSLPESKTEDVPRSQTLSFTFSEPMTTSTVTTQVTFSPAIPAFVLRWYNDGTLLEVDPTGDLDGSVTYTVTLKAELKDKAGNPLVERSIFFTTAAAPDTTPPSVVSTSPTNGSIGHPKMTSLSVTFSEPMDKAATQNAFSVYSPARTGTFSWSSDGKTMYFTPSTEYPYETLVQWQISSGANGARDQAGNVLPYTSGSFRVVRYGTVTSYSDAGKDGYLYQYKDTQATYVNISSDYVYTGEIITSSDTINYRGFLHFNLASLPSNLISITSATLYVYQSSLIGTPYGTLKADSVEYGTSLDTSDFSTPTLTSCSKTCNWFPIVYTYTLSTSNANGWKSASVLSAIRNDWYARTTRGTDSQFRLVFSGTPSNGSSDYAGFYSGDHDSTRPYLYIGYEYP